MPLDPFELQLLKLVNKIQHEFPKIPIERWFSIRFLPASLSLAFGDAVECILGIGMYRDGVFAVFL